ncbi:MAG: PhoU domain-containing protein, partial [Candidatus Omnitrophota bacterium]
MTGIESSKNKIAEMSELALKMWQDTHRAFIEHNRELVAAVLEDENKLNEFEKEITSELIESGRAASGGDVRDNALLYADVVADLEIIGDYCKDILERVEIKIEEKLLFSEDAVKEYEDLYQRTENALDEVTCALKRDNLAIIKEVLKSQEHIDQLMDVYRKKHNQRLLDGVCSPLGCNMF